MTVPGTGESIPLRLKLLKACFCAWVLALAVYQFAENTADPDLFGHVVFGQQMLQDRAVAKTEIYSWTAPGQPFFNHEFLADLILGGVHLCASGSGILLLKIGIGLLTFSLCLRLGAAGLTWPDRAFAWGLGALAVVEISFGFAARPQIFTALCLALELWMLRRIHLGRTPWAWAIPALFVFWVNTHGGALAGAGLLFLTTALSTVQYLAERAATGVWLTALRRILGPSSNEIGSEDAVLPPLQPKTIIALWGASLGTSAAMLCNPWGVDLPRWLVASVLWLRPEIQEWNPTPLNGEHAAFFILVGLALVAWAFTRKKRAGWEMAACAAFALLGARSVRNTPLCSILILALIPAHLASAAGRITGHLSRSLALVQRAGTQVALSCILGAATLGVIIATFVLHKQHPLTMAIPRAAYPVSAIEFMRQKDLRGNLLVFFDWGDLCIWQLPACRPSIDGRLDACYSRELIHQHWNLYNGLPVAQSDLDLDKADLALLPARLAGTTALAQRPGWRVVYFDNLAVVLAREAQRFSQLHGLTLPVPGPAGAATGSEPLPATNPRNTRK